MGSPSRNVQYHPPRLSEDRLNFPQPHSPSLPTHCSGKSGMRPLQPTQIMTDTGAYSDVVFGLFRLLGYRFSPRLADIGGTRLRAGGGGSVVGRRRPACARHRLNTRVLRFRSGQGERSSVRRIRRGRPAVWSSRRAAASNRRRLLQSNRQSSRRRLLLPSPSPRPTAA